MKKIKNTLQSALSAHLNLNLSRIKALSLMILAIIESKTVKLSELAIVAHSAVQNDSIFKRLQRFLKAELLTSEIVAKLLLHIMGVRNSQKLTLIFDRTNWKFGKCHINILFLCAVHRGIGIPICAMILKDKKNGCSSFFDRIELLGKFIKIFSKDRIECVLGDREFVGKCWILWLQKKKIAFVMRLSEATTKLSIDGEHFSQPSKYLRRLKNGTKRYLGFCFVGITDPYMAHVTALRTTDGELVVLLHCTFVEDPCGTYKKRWEIETMFRAMKRGGFNLEDTHITAAERIFQLIYVLSIAFCVAYKAGKLVIKNKPVVRKKNGSPPKTIIRLGLEALFDLLRPSHEKRVRSRRYGRFFLSRTIFVL